MKKQTNPKPPQKNKNKNGEQWTWMQHKSCQLFSLDVRVAMTEEPGKLKHKDRDRAIKINSVDPNT